MKSIYIIILLSFNQLVNSQSVIKMYNKCPHSNLICEEFEVIDTINKIRNGLYIKYRENGKLYKKGLYVNNLKQGTWITYFENDSIETIMNYKDGYLFGHCEFRYKEGTIQSKYNLNSINNLMENDSNFSSLMCNKSDHISYPAKALKNNIQGLVILKIKIRTSCFFEIEVLRDIGYGVGFEAKNFVYRLLNKCKSERNKKCINQEIILPFIFEIEDEIED